MVNQQATEDGINPYTNQPIQKNIDLHQPNHNVSNGEAAGGLETPGLGGAALGVAGTAAYKHYEEEPDAKYRQDQETKAAQESSKVAAPDTVLQQFYADQAAREAATISSPDTAQDQLAERAAQEAAIISAPDAPTPVNSQTVMSGGRSQGDLADNTHKPIEDALSPLTEDMRPSLAAGQSHRSVQTISNLHVPGEYPKEKKDTWGPTMPV